MNTLVATLFTSKSRRQQYDVAIHVHGLIDIPLVQGRLFCKWKLRNALNDQRGKTQSLKISDHTVEWNYCTQTKATLLLGKDGQLVPCPLTLNVKKEVHGGKVSESIGRVTIDLCDFIGQTQRHTASATATMSATAIPRHGTTASSVAGATTASTLTHGTTSTTRQYLLHQSKMNSSLKVTVEMRLVEVPGDASSSGTAASSSAAAAGMGSRPISMADSLAPSIMDMFSGAGSVFDEQHTMRGAHSSSNTDVAQQENSADVNRRTSIAMSTTRDDTNIRDGTDMAPQERTAVTALLNDDVVFRQMLAAARSPVSPATLPQGGSPFAPSLATPTQSATNTASRTISTAAAAATAVEPSTMPYSDDPEQLVEELFLQIEREKRAAWTQRRRSGESGSIGSMSGGVEWTFASVHSSLSSLRAV